MNSEQLIKFQNLLNEYDQSLTRMQGEKDLQKSISERAVDELLVDAKTFKSVAMAQWRDQKGKLKSELETQLSLLDALMPGASHD